ncbi:MAG: YqaA family protein [Hyphomicrobiaceae bacterium]
MLRGLYDWTMRLAAHERARLALFLVAFVESSFFPIPPHAMLVPMVLADRARAWWLATLTTIGSVLGGLAGYAIGYFLYESVGRRVLELYGYTEKFALFAAQYNDYGAWIVFFAGVTPFPYKVITIASGVTQLNVAVFMVASIIARALVFFVIAALLYWFGPPIRAFIERRLGLVATVFTIMLFAGFAAIRLFV